MMNNWPEKVYLRTNPDAFDQGLPENNDFQGTMWTWLHDKEKAYSVEYTRSDLALPDDLKAELNFLLLNYECIMKNCYFPDSATQTIVGPDLSHLIRIRAAIERLNGVKS